MLLRRLQYRRATLKPLDPSPPPSFPRAPPQKFAKSEFLPKNLGKRLRYGVVKCFLRGLGPA